MRTPESRCGETQKSLTMRVDLRADPGSRLISLEEIAFQMEALGLPSRNVILALGLQKAEQDSRFSRHVEFRASDPHLKRSCSSPIATLLQQCACARHLKRACRDSSSRGFRTPHQGFYPMHVIRYSVDHHAAPNLVSRKSCGRLPA